MRGRVPIGVHRDDAGRAQHVVGGVEDLIDAGVTADARVGAAGRRDVTGAAGNGVVRGKLFVPEQNLAQHPLGFRDRVFKGHRRLAQRREGHHRRGKRAERQAGKRRQAPGRGAVEENRWMSCVADRQNAPSSMHTAISG
jgi:hypothetical protein